MNFLAMAPWQAWTLLGLTATAIVVIFFLRIQHRQVLVSSSLLWERVLERRKRRSWLEILRRLISLLIALLIGLSLVLSFSESEVGAESGPARYVMMVVDTSLGMAARTSDGGSRFDKAIALATELLGGGSGGDTFVLYDSGGRVVVPATRDRDAVRAGLSRLRSQSASFRFPAIDQGAEAWLITDGVAAIGVPDTVRVLSVFEPADNVGISAFEIRPKPTDPLHHEAFLEVGNFGAVPKAVQIVLEDERQVQFRRTVELQPNQFYQNTFDLAPLAGGALEARVRADGDAFRIDDRAWVHLPPQAKVRVLVVSQRPAAITAVLREVEQVELVSMSVEEYERWRGDESTDAVTSRGFDGLILEGYAPAEPPTVPAWLVGPPAVDWLPAVLGTAVEPGEVTHRDIPLLKFVDLHDLQVERAARVAPGSATVLAGSADVPLLLAGEGRAPWLMTTFDLDSSDFSHGLGFAIFLGNLVEWFGGEAPMVRFAPGTVVVPVVDATVVDPAGSPVAVRALPRRTVFEAADPGIYLVRAGRRTVPVVVGVTGRALSAINNQRFDVEPTLPEDLPRGRILWPLLLPLVAVLLILEGFTYHRRVTV